MSFKLVDLGSRRFKQKQEPDPEEIDVEDEEKKKGKDLSDADPHDDTPDDGEDGADTTSDPGSEKRKRHVDEELSALVNEFGKLRGLDYYVKGFSVAEAREDDYRQLKTKVSELEKRAKRGDSLGASDSAFSLKAEHNDNPTSVMAAKFAAQRSAKKSNR